MTKYFENLHRIHQNERTLQVFFFQQNFVLTTIYFSINLCTIWTMHFLTATILQQLRNSTIKKPVNFDLLFRHSTTRFIQCITTARQCLRFMVKTRCNKVSQTPFSSFQGHTKLRFQLVLNFRFRAALVLPLFASAPFFPRIPSASCWLRNSCLLLHFLKQYSNIQIDRLILENGSNITNAMKWNE